ncbi:MAG TPA: zinc ABC transporter substrate-binding protein, partial [Candidatus Gallacutalibacter pullistercoris]|nr:zinc ABC transporter substrate-binding protein [Candidatus Gallacutalibacter pullistercoris]
FRIVTSFYPMYIIALNITDRIEKVEVSNMAGQQTGCLHDYQLQNKDMKNLETADAFLINGAGMESFLDKVLEQMPQLPVINASEGISLLCSDEAHEHEHDDHEHAEEEYNAHVWVSISNYIQQVETVTASLMELDPERAEQYRKNGDIYIEKLAALRDEMHQELDDLPNRDIVTFHEAFPYFAEEFNLHIAAVVNREPDSQPSAKELADAIRLIRETGVKAVFAEPQYSESAAQVISAESGATLYLLDPAATGEDDPDAYLNAMKNNLEILKEALS